jgi:hypothetical protein
MILFNLYKIDYQYFISILYKKKQSHNFNCLMKNLRNGKNNRGANLGNN